MSSIFSIPSGLPPSTADVTRMYYKYKQNNNDKLKAETFWDEAEYKFEIPCAQTQFWLPGRSYFKLQVSMMRTATATAENDAANVSFIRPLLCGDRVAPIMHFPNAFFTSAEFKLGEQVLSQCKGEMPLIAAMKDRLTKSDSWLKTIGDNLGCSISSDFEKRRDMFVPPMVGAMRDLRIPSGARISIGPIVSSRYSVDGVSHGSSSAPTNLV